jgi:tetratricopeptide (TPR) repeat protein
MKAILAAMMLATATLHASDYKKDYADWKAKVEEAHRDQALADWRKREPDNPDAWVLSANWALEQAGSINIRGAKGAPLPKGNYKLELRDGKMVVIGADGKPAGDIVPEPGRAGTTKAASYLIEGLKKWPYRADMYCGLATIYAQGQLWPEHMATLRAFVDAARLQAGKLRWCHDEALDAPEDVLLADKLHSFAIAQFDLQNEAADKRFFEIAQLVVRACPKSAKGYNDIAVFHGLSKNWKAAQPALEKASQVAPDDALVWMNLGENCDRLGKTDAARRAFQQVIDLNTDPSLVKDAQAKLEALGQKKR